ncbi:MAG: TonB C-terminal domain-containing protein, partial [Limisphaerales bacterium]
PQKTDNSAQLASELSKLRASSSRSITSKTASSTSVEMPGPGGEAFVNYRQLVAAIYERAYDRALMRAGEIGDRDDSVDVSIVIASNGRIVSSRITRNSNNPALNKLVKGILDSVDSVPGFPEGSRDTQRTFNITFDLKSRRLTG